MEIIKNKQEELSYIDKKFPEILTEKEKTVYSTVIITDNSFFYY